MMEKKNRNLMIPLLILLIIVIGVMGYYIYDLNKVNNENEKIIENMKEETNKLEQENDIEETNNREKVINELKKVLTNKQWVEDNLSLKVNAFEEEITDYSNQKRSFSVIDMGESENPIIIIKTEDAENIGVDIFILRYIDNEVNVEQFSKETAYHNSHYNIILGENNLCIEYGHMGYCGYQIFEISNSEEIIIDELDIIESEDYKELDEVENKYGLLPITIELNEENVEKHIK